MSPERLRELLESYGGRESNWPAELRESMRSALRNSLEPSNSPEPGNSPELQTVLRQARELDDLLDSYVPATAQLEQRILDALPQSALERLFAWLVPQRGRELWRPALAAALPLLVGVAIGINGVLPRDTGTDIDWVAQEQALLAPSVGVVWDE